jgi:hypothetical protein
MFAADRSRVQLATHPVARRCAHVTVLKSPSARHANRLQAKRFADRLVTIASNNAADVERGSAAIGRG